MTPNAHQESGHLVDVDLLWNFKRTYERFTGGLLRISELQANRSTLEAALANAESSDSEDLREAARALRQWQPLQNANARPVAAKATPAAVEQVEAAVERHATVSPLAIGAAALVCIVLALLSWWKFSEPAAAPVAVAKPPIKQAVEKDAGRAVAAAAPVPVAAAVLPVPVALRIHGSNTVGEKLTPALLEAYFKQRGATEVTRTPGNVAEEQYVRAQLPNTSAATVVEVHAHGSGTAFADMAGGATDIGQASRPIKPEELDRLRPVVGDLTAAGSEHVIGLDGLAVIVHPSNPMASLTTAQIAKLFSGDTQDWSAVGVASGGRVNVYARDDKSGTYDSFKSMVLERFTLKLSPAAKRFESSTELSDAVASDPQGIGFIGLPYVRTAKALAIADHDGAQPILPTAFTVGTEDYPLSRRLYFYMSSKTATPMITDFVDFVLSDAGQDVVRSIGFVSQNLQAAPPAALSDAPPEYAAIASGARRLSLNIRFRPNSDDMDTKAQRDLKRIVDYLAAHGTNRVTLLGFTDTSGDAKQNRVLSARRAKAVAEALTARGVNPATVRGLGAIMPVASNDNDTGRTRNRRVEVWLS